MENLLRQVNQDIEDIFRHDIQTTNAYIVPSRDDAGLTFKVGEPRKGKIIETCVLMADIRNSTKISQVLGSDKTRLGKIYSGFIHAMASIADEYGYVRNIIGDRIVVVFNPKDCYTNALTCAEVMNTAVTRILSKHVGFTDFKVGFGIDFGEMLVLKTGIRKRHEEQSEYKNLVWVGDAANIASKLTDMATKEVTVQNYKVKYEPLNYMKFLGLNGPLWSRLSRTRFSKPIEQPSYLPLTEHVFSEQEMFDKLMVNSEQTNFELFLGKIHQIEKLKPHSFQIPNILMTERVYSHLKEKYADRLYDSLYGLLRSDPKHLLYKGVDYKFKDVPGNVFGGNVYQRIIDKILP